jgi:hypothetical protein
MSWIDVYIDLHTHACNTNCIRLAYQCTLHIEFCKSIVQFCFLVLLYIYCIGSFSLMTVCSMRSCDLASDFGWGLWLASLCYRYIPLVFKPSPRHLGEPRPWASWPPCQSSPYPFSPLFPPLFSHFSLIWRRLASPCTHLGGWKGVDRLVSPCCLKNIVYTTIMFFIQWIVLLMIQLFILFHYEISSLFVQLQ